MTTRHPFSSSAFSPGAPWAASAGAPAFRPRAGASSQRLGRGLLVAGAVLGAALALYRNDVLLLLAQRAGNESSYLKFERALTGGPSSGTPRSLEPLVSRSRAWFQRLESGAAPAMAAAEAPAQAAIPTPPAASPAVERVPETAPRAETTSSGIKVLSLDALPVQKSEPAPAAVEPPAPKRAALEPAAPSRAAPARATPPRTAAKPERESAPAPVAKRTEAPKPKEAPAAAPKPAPAPANESPLKAAIRAAMLKEGQ